jgi:hypothetical protein
MSTSPVEHKTSPIPLEDFRAGFLKPASYSEEDIAKVMVEHLHREPEDLTDRQKRGLARFKYDGSWNLADTQNIRDLEKFFDIFNDVYFNGVLTGYGKVELLSSNSLSNRFNRSPPAAFVSRFVQGMRLIPDSKSKNPLSSSSSAKTISFNVLQSKRFEHLFSFCYMKWFMQYSLYSNADATMVVVRRRWEGTAM